MNYHLHGFKFKIKLFRLVVEFALAPRLKPYEFFIRWMTPKNKKRSFTRILWIKKDGCFRGEGKWKLL